MKNRVDELLVKAIILNELEKNPKELTDKQLEKIVKKKLKKVKKILDIYNSL